MNKRFIELVSSRRNRKEYPNPSEFEVVLAGGNSHNDRNDPVSKYSSIIKVNYTVIKGCEYNIEYNDSNTQTKFVVEINYKQYIDPKNPYSKRNYYAGFPMQISTNVNIRNNTLILETGTEFNLTSNAALDYTINGITSFVPVPAGTYTLNSLITTLNDNNGGFGSWSYDSISNRVEFECISGGVDVNGIDFLVGGTPSIMNILGFNLPVNCPTGIGSLIEAPSAPTYLENSVFNIEITPGQYTAQTLLDDVVAGIQSYITGTITGSINAAGKAEFTGATQSWRFNYSPVADLIGWDTFDTEFNISPVTGDNVILTPPNYPFIVKSSEFINSYEDNGGETYIRFWFTIDSDLGTTLPTSGSLPIDHRGLVNNTTKTLWLPESIETDNYYNSYKILLDPDDSQSNFKDILSYDGETHVIGIDTDSVLTGIKKVGIYKNIPQIITLSLEQPKPSKVFTVATVKDTYKIGDYLGNYKNLTNYYKVISISEDEKEITVDKNIEENDKESFEILPITHDNSSPFNYTGSTVSQQQMVCYEIQLLKLVLPNIELESGGRIALYPYVYVKLQNSNSPNRGITNIIYSNNPNSKDMLFRASIDDTSHPLTIPFVKLKGDDMVQTIKFKPNDNLRFGVYLPNGEPLKTELEDTESPLEPNPLLQISALFSIKRL